ncbi:GDSL esterase/lipase [Acorus calamus]|uniref:GDSL esterase/lipase n=1 Tax=Acorus calamus TaxID=4465 RepID=A0AAV9D1W7_ACOCL|nr:GDSL esterase/lipase [Acorus calamus]
MSPPTALSLAFFAVAAVAAASPLCDFPTIINLGDSNSDTGAVSAAFGPILRPYGDTHFHMPMGRYSDGRLIIDFIGVFKKLLPKHSHFSQALYTIDIGQNDIAYGFYYFNMTTNQVKLYIPDILDRLATIIKNIYGEGGRFFWIHNTAPLGCLPYLLDNTPPAADQTDHIGCSAVINEAAQYFNTKLNETVAQLRRDLPTAALTYVDIYSAKYRLISEASKHGFEYPLQACCGKGGKYNFNKMIGCVERVVVNGTVIVRTHMCKDPSVRISFDGIHFTEAANKWVFDRISHGAYSYPPIPLKKACLRHV